MSDLRTSSTGGNLVYKHLMESAVPGLISGAIYRGNKRPDNSVLEDILVRPGTITMGSNQKQYIDLLCFVQDIEQGPQHTVANVQRLEEISTAVKDVFKSVYMPAYTITILDIRDENEVPGQNQHFVFQRLYFQIHEPINL